jgi:transcriptional repressor NrdR
MKCPYCGFLRDRVVDSRESREGDVIRRRRHCLKCEKRFTSYEKIESIPFQVVKRDERREPYSREKMMIGLRIACRKRPVPAESLEDIADEIELMMQESSKREISSLELGNLVMKKLRPLDQVAYVRFASVYRRFEDVEEFLEELEDLRKKKTDDADS